jgi:hypothetical protein
MVRRMGGRLERVAEGVWIADGPEVSFFGFPYPTRMALVRLPDGRLWAWSPVALDVALREEVDAQGELAHIVTPNKLHHLFLRDWHEAWPDAQLYAGPGLPPRRPDLSFAAELTDEAPAAWRESIDQVVIRGSFVMEEVWFVHRPSRTLFIGDLVQKHDPTGLRWWQRAVMRLDGLVGEEGSTPREWRASFVDRRAAREALDRALRYEPERAILAHGEWIRARATSAVATAMAWLR